jgi:hypothetical protein
MLPYRTYKYFTVLVVIPMIVFISLSNSLLFLYILEKPLNGFFIAYVWGQMIFWLGLYTSIIGQEGGLLSPPGFWDPAKTKQEAFRYVEGMKARVYGLFMILIGGFIWAIGIIGWF